ncbi:MAG: hypothetical protein ACJ72N_19975 [Labedaea sp.]
MSAPQAMPAERLAPAAELAALFDKRSLAGVTEDTVPHNLADLHAAGIGTSGPAERVELLRILAGGCGPTAFAMAAELAEAEPEWTDDYTAAVLLGLGERAYELAVRTATGTAAALLPGTQFAVARMRASVATLAALLTRSVAAGPGPVPRFQIGTEIEALVSAAYQLIGRGDHEAAVRIGQIWLDLKASAPPFDADLARERIGKTVLGIDPNETPRWL